LLEAYKGNKRPHQLRALVCALNDREYWEVFLASGRGHQFPEELEERVCAPNGLVAMRHFNAAQTLEKIHDVDTAMLLADILMKRKIAPLRPVVGIFNALHERVDQAWEASFA